MRIAEVVAPLVAYPASEARTVTGEAFSSICGRVARVFAELTEGWVGHYAEVTADELADNFDLIRDRSGYHVPAGLWEEYALIEAALDGLRAGQ